MNRMCPSAYLPVVGAVRQVDYSKFDPSEVDSFITDVEAELVQSKNTKDKGLKDSNQKNVSKEPVLNKKKESVVAEPVRQPQRVMSVRDDDDQEDDEEDDGDYLDDEDDDEDEEAKRGEFSEEGRHLNVKQSLSIRTTAYDTSIRNPCAVSNRSCALFYH